MYCTQKKKPQQQIGNENFISDKQHNTFSFLTILINSVGTVTALIRFVLFYVKLRSTN